MIPDDLDLLEQHLLAAFETLAPPDGAASQVDAQAEALWRAQIESRNCDHAARWLQKEKRSFYSIGSAGHESNATVALALRVTDPALLHYRSGAFYFARAAQAGRDRPVRRRLRRPARARDEQGLLHPARRRREPGAALGGRDRGSCTRPRLTAPSSRQRDR